MNAEHNDIEPTETLLDEMMGDMLREQDYPEDPSDIAPMSEHDDYDDERNDIFEGYGQHDDYDANNDVHHTDSDIHGY